MNHQLIDQLLFAFKWKGPEGIGREFVWGQFEDKALCKRILTPHRMLDLIMRRSLAHHRLRCLVDGEDIHPQRYIKMSTSRRGYSVPIADMNRIGGLLETGCTIILDEVNMYDPSLEFTCRALQWWSGDTVQVNLYLTTRMTEGFELHWDDHDVIVVQLAGDKTWDVRGASRPFPMFRDAAPNYEPSEDIVWNEILREGEAIHIPRGFWHRATRKDRGEGFSLHASFGFHKRTGVDWLAWLADQSRHSALFRQDLEKFDQERARIQQDDLTPAAYQLITGKPFIEYLTTRATHQPSGRHIITHGVLGRPSTVVCITEFMPKIEIDDKTVTLTVAGRHITMDNAVGPVLKFLLSGNPVNLDDVEEKTGMDSRHIASVLLREGICAEVTPELLAGYQGLES